MGLLAAGPGQCLVCPLTAIRSYVGSALRACAPRRTAVCGVTQIRAKYGAQGCGVSTDLEPVFMDVWHGEAASVVTSTCVLRNTPLVHTVKPTSVVTSTCVLRNTPLVHTPATVGYMHLRLTKHVIQAKLVID